MRDKTIDIIDFHIKKGEILKARELLKEYVVSKKHLKRKEKLELATLYRRVDQSKLGLKLLSPLIVTEKGRARTDPTSDEIHEYTVLCSGLGLLNEAKRHCRKLEQAKDHRFEQQMAFIHISEWNYTSAKEFLLKYLENEDDENKRDIATVNLISSKVYCRDEDAESFANQFMGKPSIKDKPLFLMYIMSQLIELHYFNGEREKAEKYLKKVKDFSQTTTNLKKWDILFSNMGVEEKWNELENLKSFFKGMPNAARNLDLHKAYIRPQDSLSQIVFFHTPYPHFHNYIQKIFPEDHFNKLLLIGGEKIVFDFENGVILSPQKEKIRPMLAISRLLKALCDDGYQKKNIFELYSHVFPHQAFLGQSSINSIHQIINRGRMYLKSNDLPFSIKQSKGRYFLQIDNLQHAGILLKRNKKTVSKTSEDRINQFLIEYKGKPFTRKDMQIYCLRSSRYTLMQIEALIKDKAIKKTGKGPTSKYVCL